MAKDCELEANGRLYVDALYDLMEKHGIPEPWFYYPVFSVAGPRLGFETLFIKLLPMTPPTRVDFLNFSLSEAISIYALYSWNSVVPGYPLPLKVVHDYHRICDSEYLEARASLRKASRFSRGTFGSASSGGYV